MEYIGHPVYITTQRWQKMVAIKDFGMPSCCVNCDMCLPCALNEGLCHVTQHTLGDIYDKRPSDCPLVEIEERKVGKWVKNEHTFWTCSECGLVNKYNRVQYAYCPNCGAKMRGSEE